jgi:hypothetical protein
MANVTPEYLFQTIGELTIEGRLLRREIEAKNREIEGLKMEKAKQEDVKKNKK